MIVNKVNKSTRFLAVKIADSAKDYATLYINEIFRLHGFPFSLISNIAPQITSCLWKSLHKGLGTYVNHNIRFNPQTDGQASHTIRNLEDMLKTYVINFKGSWDDHLALTEFT